MILKPDFYRSWLQILVAAFAAAAALGVSLSGASNRIMLTVQEVTAAIATFKECGWRAARPDTIGPARILSG